MKDRWMNVGHEEEELKPYTEPEADFSDTKRIGLNPHLLYRINTPDILTLFL